MLQCSVHGMVSRELEDALLPKIYCLTKFTRFMLIIRSVKNP